MTINCLLKPQTKLLAFDLSKSSKLFVDWVGKFNNAFDNFCTLGDSWRILLRPWHKRGVHTFRFRDCVGNTGNNSSLATV